MRIRRVSVCICDTYTSPDDCDYCLRLVSCLQNCPSTSTCLGAVAQLISLEYVLRTANVHMRIRRVSVCICDKYASPDDCHYYLHLVSCLHNCFVISTCLGAVVPLISPECVLRTVNMSIYAYSSSFCLYLRYIHITR